MNLNKMMYPRVCQKEFPKGSYPKQREDGFPINPNLKKQVDIQGDNIIHDMDSVGIVSGSGRVRIGKSFIANQIGYYHYWRMKTIYNKNVFFNLERNYAFNGSDLIEKAHWLNKHNYKYSPLVYDEAGETLETTKVLTRATKAVTDYFREGGQYNLFVILVLPDFFKLPDPIAITRADYLINCYTSKDRFINIEGNESLRIKRGYFQFYSRKRKKKLYGIGKRMYNNYGVVKGNFNGRWSNLFCLDYNKYATMKQEALISRNEEMDARTNKYKLQADLCLYHFNTNYNLSYRKIADQLNQYNIEKWNKDRVQGAIQAISKRL